MSMDEDRAREIAIRILDEFEELLAAKDIKIPSGDREGRKEEACLYGSEYYDLEDAIVGILVEETHKEHSPPDPLAGPDTEARAACEEMRTKMAATANRCVQNRQRSNPPAINRTAPDPRGSHERMQPFARDVDWDFLYECRRDSTRMD
jgi:hypothetical protein